MRLKEPSTVLRSIDPILPNVTTVSGSDTLLRSASMQQHVEFVQAHTELLNVYALVSPHARTHRSAPISRASVPPLGAQEPIGQLTAVVRYARPFASRWTFSTLLPAHSMSHRVDHSRFFLYPHGLTFFMTYIYSRTPFCPPYQFCGILPCHMIHPHPPQVPKPFQISYITTPLWLLALVPNTVPPYCTFSMV